jgi:hypothetical protein
VRWIDPIFEFFCSGTHHEDRITLNWEYSMKTRLSRPCESRGPVRACLVPKIL